MSDLPTLDAYLAAQEAESAVTDAVRQIAVGCAAISRIVASGAIGGQLGAAAGTTNVQDEEQKRLDVLSDELLRDLLGQCSSVAGLASEEVDTAQSTGRVGGVLVTFDPLDGSSNIDVNVSVGTIFSVLPAPDGRAATESDFLVAGRAQLAAGYALYGPQTTLVLTVTHEVVAFTLDAEGVWRLTHEKLVVPPDTSEFSINMSNQRHWAEPIRRYIGECLLGREGSRGKDFNMRWVGSMVADVHRILMRGGIFLYPWDAREPSRPGKLRLLYEGAPMALLIERAGGAALAAGSPILDVVPTSLHQRVAIALGSRGEIEQFTAMGAG